MGNTAAFGMLRLVKLCVPSCILRHPGGHPCAPSHPCIMSNTARYDKLICTHSAKENTNRNYKTPRQIPLRELKLMSCIAMHALMLLTKAIKQCGNNDKRNVPLTWLSSRESCEHVNKLCIIIVTENRAFALSKPK
jgi:hypothetical protein